MCPCRTIACPACFQDSAYGTTPFTTLECDNSDNNDDNTFQTPDAGPSLSALLQQALSHDPYTPQEALSSPNADEWTATCQYKLDMMASTSTWDLVDLPPNHKVVQCKWVFKHKADGCFHACLVAKGFTQIHRVGHRYG